MLIICLNYKRFTTIILKFKLQSRSNQFQKVLKITEGSKTISNNGSVYVLVCVFVRQMAFIDLPYKYEINKVRLAGKFFPRQKLAYDIASRCIFFVHKRFSVNWLN